MVSRAVEAGRQKCANLNSNIVMWILVILSLLLRYIASQDTLSTDLLGLEYLYNLTNGNYWIFAPEMNITDYNYTIGDGVPWNFTEPDPNPCVELWEGVMCKCSDTICVVEEIQLPLHNISGSLPSEISYLSSLKVLNLGVNRLTGTFPNTLYSMTTLSILNVHGNFFTGNLPIDLTLLTNLRVIYLSANHFTGSLPSQYGVFPELLMLSINHNKFSGSIPDSYGNLTKLRDFSLCCNGLSGEFPSVISKLTNLSAFLDLHSNSLVGYIPTFIGIWNKLSYFDLSHNYFIGNIPTEVGKMTELIFISFYSNSISGTIPTEMGQLQRLTYLNIGNANISGSIPTHLGDLSVLGYLGLSRTKITGKIPTEFGLMTALLQVYIYYCSISGTVPSAFGNMIILETLNLSFNFLTGSVPSQLSNCKGLTALNISYNYITGKLPENIYSVSTIGIFDVSSNFLESTISPNIHNFKNLSLLGLSMNLFDGSFPALNEWKLLSEVRLSKNFFNGKILYADESEQDDYVSDDDYVIIDRALPLLSLVDISHNLFSGTIPYFLFNNATQLRVFVATSNCFVGSISSSICSASNVEVLLLSGLSAARGCSTTRRTLVKNVYLSSGLSGSLPSCLFHLNFLNILDISGNSIRSRLHELGPNVSFVNMSLSHNRLFGSIPLSWQTYPSFYKLDLSFNQLTGTINYMSNYADDIEDFLYNYTVINITIDNKRIVATYDRTVEFKVANRRRVLRLVSNRLSGYFPAEFLHTNTSINILSGNSFQCKYFPKQELPPTDPNSSHYVCGSDELNILLYIYAGGLAVVLIMYLYFYKLYSLFSWLCRCVNHWNFVEIGQIASLYLFQVTCDTQDSSRLKSLTPEMVSLALQLSRFRKYTKWITLLIVTVFLPLGTGLSAFYPTHTYQYTWIVSLGYLNGTVAAIVLCVGWMLFLGLMFYIVFDMTLASSMENLFDLHISANPWFNSWRWPLFFTSVFFLLVISIVNGFYVYITLTQPVIVIIFTLITVSVFKICVNFSLVSLFSRLGSKTFLLLNILTYNSILGPLLANMCVDVLCFQGLFIPPETVVSTYFSFSCANSEVLTPTGVSICLARSVISSETDFIPAFEYSQQCSSAVLVNYVPIYVFMLFISGLVMPSMRMLGLLVFRMDVTDEKVQNSQRFKAWKWLKLNISLVKAVTGKLISDMNLPLDIKNDFMVSSVGEQYAFGEDNKSVMMSTFGTPDGSPEGSPEGTSDRTPVAPVQINAIHNTSNNDSLSVLNEEVEGNVLNPMQRSEEVPDSNQAATYALSNVSDVEHLNPSIFTPPAVSVDIRLQNTRQQWFTNLPVVKHRYGVKFICFNAFISFVIMVTFGVVFPPVAVMAYIQIVVSTVLLQVCIHCHFMQLKKSKNMNALQIWRNELTIESVKVNKILFKYMLRFAYFGCVFFCFFIFDISQGIVIGVAMMGGVLVMGVFYQQIVVKRLSHQRVRRFSRGMSM